MIFAQVLSRGPGNWALIMTPLNPTIARRRPGD
jgi:hypothetical protein